ncbi:protein disulfide-isomerase A2 [Hypomesus transpacificus]|uniref:protein disulfide-isomerase A2 n=1 Tax=Hypomesus transpacificus TaxID=137520 RepID=UPI001F07D580|nr:protein disulfide-isomerase A2 [Hypomesus transpacificus]
MATHTVSNTVLLGLLVLGLWNTRVWSQQPEPGPEQEPEPRTEPGPEPRPEPGPVEEKKEKTTEIEEEKDVLVLHVKNFARALSENSFLLVEFYAPWCGHCRQLEPVYSEAAGLLKADSGVRFAKVDATEEEELGAEFHISSFPMLKLFTYGDRHNPITYTGKRTVAGLLQWLRRRSGPGAAVLESVQAADDIITAHNITVVGFFTSLESVEAKLFSEVVMEIVDMEFAVTTSPEVFHKYRVEGRGLVLFKKFDEGRADLMLSKEDILDKEQLTSFIHNNSLQLVTEFSEQNADQIFGSKVHTHCLLFVNSSVQSHIALLEDYRRVAKVYRGQVLFILIDVSAGLSHVLKYFGLTEGDAPTVRIINTDTVKKYALGGAITTQSLTEFCQGVLDGTIKPHLLSQELPEGWDQGPVSTLVAKNFEAVAFDPNKNVFVEFYAPWCGHCKELAPVWEKLGEMYAERDDIIIAKMDNTANELESLSVSGYPTLRYYPAGEERKVVEYSGSRDLETLSKFLDNGGTLPEETEEEEKEEKEEEEEEEEEERKEEEVTDDSSQLPANETSKDEL